MNDLSAQIPHIPPAVDSPIQQNLLFVRGTPAESLAIEAMAEQAGLSKAEFGRFVWGCRLLRMPLAEDAGDRTAGRNRG